MVPLPGRIFNIYQVPNHNSHLLKIYIIRHLPLVFLSPTSQKFVVLFAPLFHSPFSRQIYPLLATMSDFRMAPIDDSLTPKIGRTGSLDAKTFILGQGNVMGKERIQEFFNCVGNLSLEDTPILKTTRSYADDISALVLKLESKFVRTHPILQRLFFELSDIKNPRAKKLATLVLINDFYYIIREAREIFDFYGMNREKPVMDEILYNSDYALRHLLGDNKIFDENLKKEVPVLDIIQQVFNNVNLNTILGLLQEIKGVMMKTN